MVDADLPRALQLPSDHGIRQQFFLEGNPELKGQMDVEHRNVHGRCMVDGIDVRLGRINLLHANHMHVHANRSQNHARPKPGDAVLTLGLAAVGTAFAAYVLLNVP